MATCLTALNIARYVSVLWDVFLAILVMLGHCADCEQDPLAAREAERPIAGELEVLSVC